MLADELQSIATEELEARRQYAHQIMVCTGPACHACQSTEIIKSINDELKRREQTKNCEVKQVGCRGLCSAGPLVAIEPEGTLYQTVTPADAPDIVDSLERGPLERLTCRTDVPFFTRQTKIVLEGVGKLDPERIEDYIAADGYATLIKILAEMTPAQVLDELTRSGLRGRGGAGYSTGLKWSTVSKARADKKYVICNGDEGDPGAFMDRSVMEADPHRVIEGLIIAGYTVGANQGFIYVRAEYPLAVKRLNMAIRQAQKHGLLGEHIAGSAFSFTLSVRIGAGAFVCGEETALMASIEGRRGQPRPRPPYPAESGLWGKPTLINNVESYANIVPILRYGADWFASYGRGKSKGTKVFSLTGKINNTGLIEVPMGITLREIVYDIGGGIPDGRQFKAVQTGGPSGGCIPAQHLDSPVDFESLNELGAFMGSGGMIIMDDSSCMVDVARYFMEFCMEESCGKCVPCRVGTAQMHDILLKITQGEATLDDLALLEQLCDVVRNTSLCGLGQSAPNSVISTLRYFRDEYLAHIVDKCCPAGVCEIHQPEVNHK